MLGLKAEMEEMGSCPICLDAYNRRREPKMLGCGHSLCGVCAERMVGDKRRNHLIGAVSIACPICRSETQVPSGGLPTNFSLQEVLSKFTTLSTRAKGEGWRVCTACQEPQCPEDFWYCADCGERAPSSSKEVGKPLFLCSRCCLRYHNGHRLLGLAEQNARVAAVSQRLNDAAAVTSEGLAAFSKSFGLVQNGFQGLVETLASSREEEVSALRAELSEGSGLVDVMGVSARVDALRRRQEGGMDLLREALDSYDAVSRSFQQRILSHLAGVEMAEETSGSGAKRSLFTAEPLLPEPSTNILPMDRSVFVFGQDGGDGGPALASPRRPQKKGKK